MSFQLLLDFSPSKREETPSTECGAALEALSRSERELYDRIGPLSTSLQ
jgi:hypothetical protein